MFIEFAQRMIKWVPEERSTAKELLQDPWLYAELGGDRNGCKKHTGSGACWPYRASG
jgi:hypothetical protein